MTCRCCETGQCCNGSECSSKTKSECRYGGGEFTEGGCEETPCVYDDGKTDCSNQNGCQCYASNGYQPDSTTCHCGDLAAEGFTDGGCATLNCKECNTETGECESTCPSPRACCEGTCCPEDQKCQSSGGSTSSCVDKCSTGKTYCANTTTPTAYHCCSSGEKCCGPEGCKSTTPTTDFTIDVTVNGWVDTGVDVPSSGVTISASGTVRWATGPDRYTGPNGLSGSDCDSYPACNAIAMSSFGGACHMALVGRIGTGGTGFSVGSSYSGSPGTGRLYLRQNDTCVADNAGTFTGTISVEEDPCPDYTPASVGDPIVYHAPDTPSGPGVELKALLKLAGIEASPTCSCNARARQMDEWGEFTCLKRLPEITGWLGEEAKKRDLWFFAPAGVALILLAISLAALKRLWKGINR